MVRQLTLPEHYGGKVFRWHHRTDLLFLNPPAFWVRGSFGDDWLYTKYANPANVYEAVWGLPDLLVALCTDRRTRTQPSSHCALAGRPGQPLVGLVAVHFFFRLRREGIPSPTNIIAIVFHAGSHARGLFNPCVAPPACNAA